MSAKTRRRRCSESRELLRVSLSMTSRSSRTPDPRKRRPSLMRLPEKSRNVRELLLPRKPLIRRPTTRTRLPNRKLRTRLPRRPRRRLEAKARNDRIVLFKSYFMAESLTMIWSLNIGRSELELMGSGVVGESESGAKVALQVLNLLDVFQ